MRTVIEAKEMPVCVRIYFKQQSNRNRPISVFPLIGWCLIIIHIDEYADSTLCDSMISFMLTYLRLIGSVCYKLVRSRHIPCKSGICVRCWSAVGI